MPARRWLHAAAYATALAVVMTTSAHAHSGEGVAGGFVAGLSHPIGGLDHLLAMVAVGLWGAFLGKPMIWQLPIAFPLMMVVGGVLGITGVPLPFVEQGIAASVLILGLAIAAAWKAPRLVALAIVAIFAVFHGHAHGAELPDAADAAAYSAGFVLATGALHLVGILIGQLAVSAPGRIVVRIIGLAIAVLGGWILLAGFGYLGDPPELPPLH